MTKRRRFTIIGVIVGALMVISVVAYAAATVRVTNGINNVRIKTETTSFSTDSETWVDLPGAQFNMAVPGGLQKTFIAQFSAESNCTGSAYCSVRILMDGAEMDPAVGIDFAFDSAADADDHYEGHSMTRVGGPVGPGQHSFNVQVRVVSATDFWLDDWTFMVMKAAS